MTENYPMLVYKGSYHVERFGTIYYEAKLDLDNLNAQVLRAFNNKDQTSIAGPLMIKIVEPKRQP